MARPTSPPGADKANPIGADHRHAWGSTNPEEACVHQPFSEQETRGRKKAAPAAFRPWSWAPHTYLPKTALAADRFESPFRRPGRWPGRIAATRADGLDRKAGFELAMPEAGKIALRGGSADVIVSDWLRVSRELPSRRHARSFVLLGYRGHRVPGEAAAAPTSGSGRAERMLKPAGRLPTQAVRLTFYADRQPG
jgi:hypothetical protein